MKKYIVVNFEVEWLHNRPECDIEGMEYLRSLHRHIFHISCKREVSHNDRDVEIIIFKREISHFLKTKYNDPHYWCLLFGRMSCEDIAELLIEKFWLSSCEVLEDGENWAFISNE